jgi:hypothetical protein
MRRFLYLSAIVALVLSGPLSAPLSAQDEVIKETESEGVPVQEGAPEAESVPVPEPESYPEDAATDNEGRDIVEGIEPEPPAEPAAPSAPAAGSGAPPVEAPPTWAHWYFMTEPDPRSGGIQQFAFVTERDDPYGRIYVQCTGEGRLYVFITTPFLGLNDKKPPIRYRINKQKIVGLNGVLSQDGRAVFLGEKRGAFLRDLVRGNTMEVATQRQDGYAITLSFTLTGSSNSIGRVLRACDYDPKSGRTAVEREADTQAEAQAELDAHINREFRKPRTGIQVETLY